MDHPRKRFLASAILFLAWVLGLAYLAVGSGRLPRKAADVPRVAPPASR